MPKCRTTECKVKYPSFNVEGELKGICCDVSCF